MLNKPWFDATTDTLLLSEYVMDRPSYKAILEDGVITEEELTEQAHRFVGLLQKLESALTPEAKDIATDALCELALLHTLHYKIMQNEGGAS